MGDEGEKVKQLVDEWLLTTQQASEDGVVGIGEEEWQGLADAIAKGLRQVELETWERAIEGVLGHKKNIGASVTYEYQLALDLALAWMRQQAKAGA